jgi:hypothetical protein
MDNQIASVSIQDRRVNPATAELEIWVHPRRGTSEMHVRGRLVGPHCYYSSTVEVAYPFIEDLREWQKAALILLRVVIPEPSLWDPVTPFLYTGHVELWDNGRLCEQIQISHGLRMTPELGPQGLRWNGRPLSLHGVRRSHCGEDEALQLHRVGYNLILAPATLRAKAIWRMAEQFGFLVLGFIEDREGYRQALEIEQSLRVRHKPVSCLGWVLAEPMLQDPDVRARHHYPAAEFKNRLFGVELKQRPSGPLPPEIRFVVCEEALLPSLSDIRLPKLVSSPAPARSEEEKARTAPPPGILGWIVDSALPPDRGTDRA